MNTEPVEDFPFRKETFRICLSESPLLLCRWSVLSAAVLQTYQGSWNAISTFVIPSQLRCYRQHNTSQVSKLELTNDLLPT